MLVLPDVHANKSIRVGATDAGGEPVPPGPGPKTHQAEKPPTFGSPDDGDVLSDL